MALGFLTAFRIDVVGVYTQDFTQVFAGARPIKATVKEESKPMEHPIETGETITDHRIILPIEIELSMILTSSLFQDVYAQIKQLYLNATLLTVQTRTSTYTNQYIVAMPHQEDTGMQNAISLALKLKEAQFSTSQVTTVVVTPKNPANSSTIDRGNQQPATPPVPQQSVARDIFGGIT